MRKDRASTEARRLRRERGRKGIYREDCTYGSFSVLNPKSYKGDALVQVWMDSRELATISLWLDREGNYTRFLSEVVKDSLHILCEDLIADGEVSMIEGTAEARNLLERKYRINLNPNGRGEKNLLHNIILSERRGDEGVDINTIKEKPRMNIRELSKQALEVYNSIGDNVPIENRVFSTSQVKREMYTEETVEIESATKQNEVIVKEKMSPEEIEAVIKKSDEEEKRQMEALSNLNLEDLMSGAVKG